jgi:DNA-binding response OmpR family regulator
MDHFKILVAEGDSDISELIKITLFSPFYSITCVDTVTEAFTKLMEQKPDLVVVDLLMPELDGWKLYKAIRAKPECNRTRVVILTDLPFMPEYHILPADLAMEKPLDLDQLRTNVKNLLTADETPDVFSLKRLKEPGIRTRVRRTEILADCCNMAAESFVQ